jgi:hypothetical protein
MNALILQKKYNLSGITNKEKPLIDKSGAFRMIIAFLKKEITDLHILNLFFIMKIKRNRLRNLHKKKPKNPGNAGYFLCDMTASTLENVM